MGGGGEGCGGVMMGHVVGIVAGPSSRDVLSWQVEQG